MTERTKRTSSTRDRVLDAAKREKQKAGGSWIKYNLPEGKEMFVPKKGTMHLDILPFEVTVINNYDKAEKGELWYRRKLLIHKSVGAEGNAYICPTTIGKPCPICKALAPLRSKYKENKAIIDAETAKEREILNILDLDDQDKGVQFWDISSHLFGKKLLEELEEGKEEWRDFFQLKGGFTLRIRFKEKELGENTFLETARIDFEPRDDYDETILGKVVDLDIVFSVPSYDELEKAHLDLQDEDKTPTSAPTEEEPIRRTRKVESSDTSKDECPNGGTWGADCEKKKECGKCPQEIWDKCMDEQERLKKDGK